MKKIAIIGTGIMGAGIAQNFLKNKYEVKVWNRTKEKLAPLLQNGATAAATPREAAEWADMVFDVTANDESSKSIWMGKNGILDGARGETILVGSGTFSIAWTDELADVCKKQEKTFLDIPLTGSRVGAEGGSLVLLAGGDKEILEKIKPDLSAISQKILYFGPVGSGMRFKLILNSLQAIHLLGLGEMLKLAKEMGLDLNAVGEALCERPGGTTTQLAWKGFKQPPENTNFSVQWILKDLLYTKKEAKSMELPLLESAIMKFQNGVDKGLAEKDWTKIESI